MTTDASLLFPGITARVVETERIRTNILEREGDSRGTPHDRTVVFVHGNVSSSLFWQELMLALPSDMRAIAIDLRGFGDSETAPVDATRGVRDYSDDVHAALTALGIESPHLVGWSLGGGVVMQYALDHPVRSLTLQAPVSPYGFGGTRRDGSRLTDDDAGTGGGGANPDFIERLRARDTSDEAATSPLNVYRASYVSAGFTSDHEDVWVQSMLSTSTEPGNYPGDSKPSESWPGFAAGDTGNLNTLTPGHFNTADIVNLETKPPILWIWGTADAIVNDASFFDINQLGAAGIIPDWPGADVAPPQEMIGQTRDVLDTYQANGGYVIELKCEGVGHAPHLERPTEVRDAIVGLVEGAEHALDS